MTKAVATLLLVGLLGILDTETSADPSPRVPVVIDYVPGDSVEILNESGGSLEKVYVGRRADGMELFTIKRGSTAGELVYTPDNNFVSMKFGSINRSYAPHRGDLVSPLFVGQSWNITYTENDNGALSQRTKNAKVAAYEQIETPAGSFWAFRIEATNQRADRPLPAYETYWYAPDVGDIIKYQSRELTGQNRVLTKFHRTPKKAPTN